MGVIDDTGILSVFEKDLTVDLEASKTEITGFRFDFVDGSVILGINATSQSSIPNFDDFFIRESDGKFFDETPHNLYDNRSYLSDSELGYCLLFISYSNDKVQLACVHTADGPAVNEDDRYQADTIKWDGGKWNITKDAFSGYPDSTVWEIF